MHNSTHLWSFGLLGQFQGFLFKSLHTSKGRSDHDADAFGVLECFGCVPQLGILEGESSRCNRKMRVSVVGFSILWVDKVVIGVEHFVGDFTANLARVILNVKALDLVDTGFTLTNGLEEIVGANTTTTDDSQACHYHPLFVGEGRQGRCLSGPALVGSRQGRRKGLCRAQQC